MPPVSLVRMTFEGMLILFVNKSSKHCDVGFLRGIPHHSAQIQITKTPRGGAAEILEHLTGSDVKDDLRLEVNKANPQIKLFRSADPDPFVRHLKPGKNDQDFRWAVDLEGHEVYNTTLKPGIDLRKLKQRLRIFDGTFFNLALSDNELTRKRSSEPNPVVLGRVAVQLRAEIELADNQEATFSYGSKKRVLRAETNMDYGIYVCNKRDPGHGGHQVDAEHYHPAVAGSKPRVKFDKHPPTVMAATPDAVCLPAWMGKSEL